MKSNHTRKPLHQQSPETSEKPFFSKGPDNTKKKDDVFFQTKMAVGEKGDKHEKEADTMAHKVQQEDSNTVQKKEEEKKESVIQKKQKDEEKTVQKMSDSDKENKDAIQKKEADGPQKEEAVQLAKSSSPSAVHPLSIQERLKSSKGKGQPLPIAVRQILEQSLNADFSNVVIHADKEASVLAHHLQALAFTNGFDVYFAEGQYQPFTLSGKKLLAHELTHVIQQTGVAAHHPQKEK